MRGPGPSGYSISACGIPPKIGVIAGSSVHAALLRDVRLLVHGLSLRVPAAADGAVPHSCARRQHGCGGAVPRLPDLRVGVLGADHGVAGGPSRTAADA